MYCVLKLIHLYKGIFYTSTSQVKLSEGNLSPLLDKVYPLMKVHNYVSKISIHKR